MSVMQLVPSTLCAPKVRTWKRWRRVACSPHTVLRALMYEVINGLELRGNVLDIGGGKINGYHHLLKINGKITTLNISKSVDPDMLLDLNNELPFATESIDTIISLNTFEHIRRDEFAVREAFRVLKKGGTFHILVPFLFHVHGAPHDYNRRTAQWWHELLLELGVTAENLKIEPLVWDRNTTALSVMFRNRLINALRRVVMLLGVCADMFITTERRPLDQKCSAFVATPLGYYLCGIKA